MNKALRQLRYIASRYTRKLSKRLAPRDIGTNITFPSLGAESLPHDAPRALIFFAAAGIERLAEGKDMDDPVFHRHTIPGDAVSMVKILNSHGYIVDFCDLWKVTAADVDWQPYKIVIDNADNFKHAPIVKGQIRINFVNYNNWLFNNQAELERIRWFRERTGILVPANRILPSYMSDQYADYMTYYGTDFQLAWYSPKPIKIPLSVCALPGRSVIPPEKPKNISRAKSRFMWLGGGGMLYKGADIVIEAFQKLPEAELFLCGNLEQEPEFWQWAKNIIDTHPNIHYQGWVDTTESSFDELADSCIGIVYPSSTEGGPGTVARVMFNGVLPIVTKSSNVRGEHLGFIIEGSTAQALIESTVHAVQSLMRLNEDELQNRTKAVRTFACENHTREAFNKSFSDALTLITSH